MTVEKQAAAIAYWQRGLHMLEDGSIWALRDGIFLAGSDRILVVKGYMDSMMTKFGAGTKPTDAETSLAVICYQLGVGRRILVVVGWGCVGDFGSWVFGTAGFDLYNTLWFW